MVLLEPPAPGEVGPPHVADVGSQRARLDALLLRQRRTRSAATRLAGRPFAVSERVHPPHPEAHLELVVRAGAGQPGHVAEHLDHHDVEPLVQRLVELAQVGVDQPGRGQPEPGVVGHRRRRPGPGRSTRRRRRRPDVGRDRAAAGRRSSELSYICSFGPQASGERRSSPSRTRTYQGERRTKPAPVTRCSRLRGCTWAR